MGTFCAFKKGPFLFWERFGVEMTLFDVFEKHAVEKPTALAFAFFDSSGEPTEISNEQLLIRVRAVARLLQTRHEKGDCVVLMYQPGLDFIAGILACFAVGMIAVPVQPLQNKRVIARLKAVIENSTARTILTNSATLESLHRIAPDLFNQGSAISSICIDRIDENLAHEFVKSSNQMEDLAFLQYTSGSTGTPKGVMVSHGNLLDNSAAIKEAFGHNEESIVGGWLPLYHDMGLIGNVFQPLYLGVPCVLFSPMTFLMSPVTWLRAITKWKLTSSGGPNFAYDLCTKNISDEDLMGLDLSSWKVAFNGAEPVRAKVIKEFTERFSKVGFKPEAFYPCYGMAEATLFLTGGHPEKKATIISVDPSKLANQIVEESPGGISLVSCGKSYGANQFVIVDPDTHERLKENQVGEIWMSGPSVTLGYWKRPDLSEEFFNARLATGEGPFLRTGDLGFSFEGELYINGRLKDLIIVRGQNHYPDDIEATVYESHKSLRPHGTAVFTVGEGEEQKLIVVAEIERLAIAKLDEVTVKEILAAVRKDVSERHGLRVSELQLIKPASLPKTSSGKVQRRRARDLFLANELSKVNP